MVKRHEHNLVLSTFTSVQTSLLTSNRASYGIYVFVQLY